MTTIGTFQHTCAFCESYNPETLEPIKPNCGKPATQEIYWQDGRVSSSCEEHGWEALDDSGRELVARITRPTCEFEWTTIG